MILPVCVLDTQNRKNDEASYEKMLKLRRDLSRAVTILEMIKRREKSKRELLHLTLEVFEKRLVCGRNTAQTVTTEKWLELGGKPLSCVPSETSWQTLVVR